MSRFVMVARGGRRWLIGVAAAAVIALIVALVPLAGPRERITGTTSAERVASLGRIVDQQLSGAKEAAEEAATDPDPKLRQAGVVALGRLKYRLDLVRSALNDPEAMVRSAAATTMGCFDDPCVVDVLSGVLDQSDTATCLGAVTGLARRGTSKAISRLAGAMDHAQAEVRVAAMNALVQRANVTLVYPPCVDDPPAAWRQKVQLVKRFPSVSVALRENPLPQGSQS